MEHVNDTQAELLNLNADDTTEIAVAALLTIYDSQGDLSTPELIETVVEQTSFSHQETADVITRMFDSDYPFIMTSSAPERDVVFAAAGLWLVDDSMCHGEDNIDIISIAKQSLSKSSVFK